MKRQPIERTLAELPQGDRPPRIPPPLPDIIPVERPWVGSAWDELRAKDEEVARLRAELAAMRAHCAALEADVRELSARGRG